MIIAIQPKQREDGVLPYPYFIDEKGKIGRQDFWKGEPYMLIGFNPKPKTGDMPGTIDIKIFLKDPKKCIGMYPIFAHKNGEWYTYQDQIESVREIKEKQHGK